MSSAYYTQNPPYQQYQQTSGYQAQNLQPRQPSYPTSQACGQQYYSEQPSQKPNAQYLCLYPQCASAGTGFARYADLQRHVAIVHGRQNLQLVDCSHPGCHRRGEYGFTRKDKMVDHLRDVHKSDIPKRASGKRSP
ncbi:hypothetical protein LTR36_009262 [Oleoguttula mirabilis]|uniref:C2H2-type domain-containing protein n=1 Tax=Oleoguttula mirabilis TaxID=1507867 RepID=A0AAV9J6J7_9PEZI|nr:hypothetical protein LTR36_009262 [Oleoguttula mirabilis]